MSPITKEFTKEQLIQKLKHRISVASGFPDSEKAKMDLELARIALASLEAEPVCVIDQTNLDYLKSGADADVWPASRKEMGDVLLYRTAPPATVSVPDGVLKNLLPDAEKPEFWFEHNGTIFFEGVKFNNAVFDACRAAMLQGAEPVTTAYKLPAIGWLRADYQDDNRGLRGNAPLFVLGKKNPSSLWGLDYIPLTAKSPVIPDGWVACSERMPDIGTEIFYFCQDDGLRDCGIVSSSNFSGKGDAQLYVHAEGYDLRFGVDITHWMPMPATPQQEADNG